MCQEKIGQGAFGNVFKAKRNDGLKKYAIKQLVIPDKESKLYEYLNTELNLMDKNNF